MGGDFEFGCKIKTTYPSVHPSIWSLALRPKLWLQRSDLYFKPKNADFEHLDKILPLFQGLGDGNETYCGSLWHRTQVSQEQRNFWNRKIFHGKIHQNLTKFQEFLKHLAPPSNLLQRVPNDKFHHNKQNIQNLEGPFWLNGHNCNLKLYTLKLMLLEMWAKTPNFVCCFGPGLIKYDEIDHLIHIWCPQKRKSQFLEVKSGFLRLEIEPKWTITQYILR